MLQPYIVGKWDANHVWVQWTPGEANACALRLRYLRKLAPDWTPWVETMTPWPLRGTCYVKIPTRAQGTQVQAQLAEWQEGGELMWETARAAEFARCEAEFEFLSDLQKVTFAAGDLFTAMVDADVATFRLREALEVYPGTPARVRMEATQESGVFQLDYPGHFAMRPRRGVVLANTTPTVNDLKALEGETVTVAGKMPGGPMSIALGKVNQPRT